MNISIKKSSVRDSGKQICDATLDFSSDIKKLENIINNINSAWDGADALKYVNNLKESYIVRLNELAANLENYGEYLINVAKVYDLLDETFSNKNINV